jgi:tetratricopeptide (TPR) repeat protein
MSLRSRPAVAVVALVLLLAGAAAAQPPPPPPPPPSKPAAAPQPSVPATPIAAAQQSEADRKFAEITTSTTGDPEPAAIVPKLQQFIKEYPEYPGLEAAYSAMLGYAVGWRGHPETVLALADEALAKFPDPGSSVRASAIRAKFAAYRDAKDAAGESALARRMLETETSPAMLEAAARSISANRRLALLEKAIAQRAKEADASGAPTLDTLRWELAESFSYSGRHDDAVRLAGDLINQMEQGREKVEAFQDVELRKSQLAIVRQRLSGRYSSFATILSRAGRYERALDCVQRSEQADASDPLEKISSYEPVRAGIYMRMEKPDLALESHVRAFSAGMDVRTRDAIRDLSARLGKSPDDAYARAREYRTKRATPIKGFELKTLEGATATLDSLRGKVTLVSFFSPT